MRRRRLINQRCARYIGTYQMGETGEMKLDRVISHATRHTLQFRDFGFCEIAPFADGDIFERQ